MGIDARAQRILEPLVTAFNDVLFDLEKNGSISKYERIGITTQIQPAMNRVTEQLSEFLQLVPVVEDRKDHK